jgi:hypothetical protein
MEKNTRLENASYLGRQWLRVLPTQKQNTIADPETTEALRNRLLIPCRPINRPCTYCGNQPSIGHEDTCRAANRQWSSRHNQVSRAFIKTLTSREGLVVEAEPLVEASSDLRADFSVLIGATRQYYDVQIVAVNKDSAKEDAYNTLAEAATAKRTKYKVLGSTFHPLVFSAGGLMELDTAAEFRSLQKLLGPTRAKWLSTSIALALTQAKGRAATSIARSTPKYRY